MSFLQSWLGPPLLSILDAPDAFLQGTWDMIRRAAWLGVMDERRSWLPAPSWAIDSRTRVEFIDLVDHVRFDVDDNTQIAAGQFYIRGTNMTLMEEIWQATLNLVAMTAAFYGQTDRDFEWFKQRATNTQMTAYLKIWDKRWSVDHVDQIPPHKALFVASCLTKIVS